jgi:hypothetical protein
VGGRGLWAAYAVQLERRPVAVKASTSALISLGGDVLCQTIVAWGEPEERDEWGEKKRRRWDWVRSAQFALLGGVLVGPTLHWWYGLLGRRVPGISFGSLAKRIALDQFVFSPVFTVVFFSSLMFVQGRAAKIPQKLRQDYWPTLISNWAVWMPAQVGFGCSACCACGFSLLVILFCACCLKVINFRYVPALYQVLYSNFIAVGWNSFLSYQLHKNIEATSIVAAPPEDE